MNVPAPSGDASSEANSLLSSQLTGREFGGSAAFEDDDMGSRDPQFSSLSLSGSSAFTSERPAALLRSSESLVSVTSSSKPPSERSHISLTPPSGVGRRWLSRHGSHLETGWKLGVGLLIVVVIALSWVGSTQTAKSSFSVKQRNGTFEGTFEAPFFVVWFGTGWMMVVYPLSCVLFFLLNRDKWNRGGVKELWSHSTRLFSPNGITLLSLLTSTVPFTLIWVATNYMYTRALTSINASDVTAIFSSAPAFVFLLSLLFLKEPPLFFRMLAVLLAVGGIVLFAHEDGFGGEGGGVKSITGVLLSVGAAIGAAFYKVLLKLRLKEASIYQMSLFLSSLGLFSTLLLWPVVLILDFTNCERIYGSEVEIPWLFIITSSALSVVFNFSINFGIAYTYPLFISLGTVLGIPINGVVDLLARGVNLFSTWKFVAVDLIVAGFLLMLLPPQDSHYVQRLFRPCYRHCCCCCCSRCRYDRYRSTESGGSCQCAEPECVVNRTSGDSES